MKPFALIALSLATLISAGPTSAPSGCQDVGPLRICRPHHTSSPSTKKPTAAARRYVTVNTSQHETTVSLTKTTTLPSPSSSCTVLHGGVWGDMALCYSTNGPPGSGTVYHRSSSSSPMTRSWSYTESWSTISPTTPTTTPTAPGSTSGGTTVVTSSTTTTGTADHVSITSSTTNSVSVSEGTASTTAGTASGNETITKITPITPSATTGGPPVKSTTKSAAGYAGATGLSGIAMAGLVVALVL